jgi:protocatechuate 3,4-dioxygenase beta subunit
MFFPRKRLNQITAHQTPRLTRYLITSVIPLVLFLLTTLILNVNYAGAAGNLSVEIIAAPNLIVDSNVLSPSSYQPIVATIIGKFCNTSATSDLTGVTANIGDYTSGTPGIYPVKSDVTIGSTTYEGDYSFTHLGGKADATRFIGDLAPGECNYQYWSFEYPKTATSGAATIPAWGNSVKPDDDLSLDFDIWASGYNTGTASTDITPQSHTMTMRNEISAMANKIKPNGNPGGVWFNTDTSSINPGDTITTNGILYRLGNINQGFDNNNDGVPDYNAWLQPFGNPSYDPSCFRLISSTGVLTVTRSSGNADMVIPFTDQLYFTDLPSDNTNVIGEVFYEFLSLGGPCSIPISPYQEVASGSDNEKFNGDYGTGIPPVVSFAPEVEITKSAPGAANENTTVTYSLGFVNNSATTAAGLTLSSGGSVDAGLMISDTIPAGLVYIAGSAAANNTIPTDNSVTIRYYNTVASSWTTTEPTAANVGAIQWWLNEPLAVNGSGNNAGTATFQAAIPATYISGGGDPFIENCATGSFGDGDPFAEACATTMVNGTNSIGDYVWADIDADGVQDGSETGINGVTVWLYWDENGDGVLDDGEMLVDTTETLANGFDGYYEFTGLPSGDYIVKVDGTDSDIPTGYNYTTPKEMAVTGLSGGTNGVLTVDTVDFGFGPILNLTKSLTNGQYDGVGNDNLYEGQLASYLINVINTRPGGTDPDNFCQYTVWSGSASPDGPSNSEWQNMPTILGPADSSFAYTIMSDNQDKVILSDYFTSQQAGVITNVQYVMYVRELSNMGTGDAMEVLITDNAGVPVYDSTDSNDFNEPNFFSAKPAGELYVATVDLGTLLDWADFDSAAATPINAMIIGNPGPPTGGELELDAAAFIITTDVVCGEPADTLNPVPVTDTYNAAELEFVSANPPISSQTPPGTLTWNNVGPLEAGDVQQIEVVFKVLATSGVVNNAAASTTAKYLDGRSANSTSDNVNADILPAHTIGDYVWFDANGDNVQDGTEPGLAGVVVELYLTGNTTIFYNGQYYSQGDLVATITTDANGRYLFEGVPGSLSTHDYQVRINEASSPILTNLALSVGSSDPYGIANLSGDIATADFGYTSANSIVYGFVWHDKDADADDPAIDTNENYIAGVTVELCADAAGTSCTATTTTDENGRYQFTDVANGTYYVVVTAPGTQVAEPTSENNKAVCGTCNDASPAIVVNSGTDKIYGGYDFGYTGADIGDTLYVDWDGSGTQDTGEEGIPNVNVYLYQDLDGDGIVDADDVLLETAVTNTSGNYSFSNYPAGKYLIIADTGDPDFPGSYTQTADPDATLDNKHSLATNGIDNVDTVDFGYQPQGTSSIGDLVWADLDGDGVKSDRETGIENVAVTLYQDQDGDGNIDAEDAVVATTTTDANGAYLFSNLAAGNYIVGIDGANFNAGQPLINSSHTNGTQNNRHRVALAASQDYDLADFGYANSAIGDLVWQDNDGDGTRDPGEPGINGVTVNLYEDTNNNGVLDAGETTVAVATAVTANDDQGNPGHYYFGSLPAGNYVVKVDTTSPALANHTLTGDPDSYNTTDPINLSCTHVDAAACDDAKFFDNLPSTSPHDLNPGLALGQTDLTADFGYQPQGVIGETVWIDSDNDGLRDGSEQGIPDITVNLCSDAACLTVLETTTTDENGEYSFGGLTNGLTYYVQVDTGDADFPTGLSQTYDPDVTPDNTGSYTVNTGVNNGVYLDMDFGYRFAGTNSITGTAWHDTDSGGQIGGAGDMDAGETIRYKDVPVYLWNCGTGSCADGDETLVGSTFTDASGNYAFNGLADGTYRVIANPSALSLRGTTPTTTTDYDSSPASDPAATLSGGSTATRDFGFLSHVDLGDLPTAYAVTALSNNGARHNLSSNLYLGASQPDADADGVESAAADGDGVDDNDGVTRQPAASNPAHGGWTNGTVAGTGDGGSLEITIGGSWSGVPQVFIDFDGNDTAYSLSELILRDSSGNPLTMPLAPGVHRVYFDIPAGTFDGVTPTKPIFLRVRLSTDGGLGVTGLAANGEVEDYRHFFGPTAVSLQSVSAKNDTAVKPILMIFTTIILSFVTMKSIRRRKDAMAE